MSGIALLGFAYSKADFSKTHALDSVTIKRIGFEHAVGSSLSWMEGKDGWLFLGNRYDDTIAKLKLTREPSQESLSRAHSEFSAILDATKNTNTRVVLIIAPDKHSVYSEYLPAAIRPGAKRYVDFFTERLASIERLIVYDPINNLKDSKLDERLLYWRTDTHWNSLGAFVTFDGLMKRLELPTLEVNFEPDREFRGDLTFIANLTDFPVRGDDGWRPIFKKASNITEVTLSSTRGDVFPVSVVKNDFPLVNKRVWLIGDSFANGIKPYLYETFAEVYNVGHVRKKLKELPILFEDTANKPDLIFIVKVERSF
jgi:hypothetical protein